MSVRIGILGYTGRMGQEIAAEVAQRVGCVLAGGLVRDVTRVTPRDGVLFSTRADEVMAVSDVVIDFTLAEATTAFVQQAVACGKPLICGTTGLGADAIAALKKAGQTIPVLYAPNTSLSLAAMKQITTLAARLLGGLDYDVAIVDEHHRMKKDAPSGTATALGNAVLAGNEGQKQPSYAAIRAGSIVGEHEVIFAGQGETIRLRHSVTDRRIFARGAVDAALWLQDKPAGFYGMDDVLGLAR